MTTSPSEHTFTIEEIKAIYRIIEKEWINREDLEAMDVATRISKIVERDELASRNHQTT